MAVRKSPFCSCFTSGYLCAPNMPLPWTCTNAKRFFSARVLPGSFVGAAEDLLFFQHVLFCFACSRILPGISFSFVACSYLSFHLFRLLTYAHSLLPPPGISFSFVACSFLYFHFFRLLTYTLIRCSLPTPYFPLGRRRRHSLGSLLLSCLVNGQPQLFSGRLSTSRPPPQSPHLLPSPPFIKRSDTSPIRAS